MSESLFIFGFGVLENDLFSGICKYILKLNDPGSIESLSLCCFSQVIKVD